MAAKKKPSIDPFDDEMSDEPSSSAQQAKELEDKIEKGGPREIGDESVNIQQTEAEVELEESEEERETRRERRRNRYREAQERANRAEQERNEALRIAQMAQLQAQHAMQGGQRQQETDQYQQELEQLEREQEVHHGRWAQLTDAERADQKIADQYVKKAREIQYKQYEVIARRSMERSGVRPSSPNDHITARLQMDYPEVMSNPQARQYAEAECRRRMALAGAQAPTWDMLNDSMKETRRAFRMGGAPPPSRESQSRYTGVSRGAGSGASGRQTMKLTKDQLAMAQARYPNDKPAVAAQKWANTVGKRLLVEKS